MNADEYDKRMADIGKGFPVGTRFEYLGRTMLVVFRREYTPAVVLPFAGIIGPFLPELRCEYVDNHGVIHEKVFDWRAMSQLKHKP